VGRVRIYEHFSGFGFFPLSDIFLAHPPLTQTVETVEKVTFPKLFLKSGRETLKSAWFLVFRTTFWQHFGNF
jgi:hypothetical protein